MTTFDMQHACVACLGTYIAVRSRVKANEGRDSREISTSFTVDYVVMGILNPIFNRRERRSSGPLANRPTK